MARYEFKLPDIGEGVTEGEVVAWHVKVGDRVVEDQLMVEVMTDKATVTIGAPKAGRIDGLLAEVGSLVKVGDVLVVIHTGNGSKIHGALPAPTVANGGPVASAVGDIQEQLPGTRYFAEKRAAAAPEHAPEHVNEQGPARGHAEPAAYHADRPLATPATRKLARDLTVDLHKVPPSGPGGRVTKDDVLAHSTPGTELAPATGAAPAPATGAAPAQPRRAPAPDAAGETRTPFVGMRRRIAENMTLSKHSAAHFTFVEECEVDELSRLRERLRPLAAAQGVELTYLPFILKAVVAALQRHPKLNSRLDTETNEVVTSRHCHLGIAAATEQGLVVPVVHHAERLSILELARECQRLADAARAGKLTREELSGSTFTVTSLGKQSGLFAVPIINYPNVGILGVHRIKERPVVRDGAIVIGKVMLLSLSMDHRLVDGHEGAAFAYEVIRLLEEPGLFMLEG
jgi:pyruvate dehydrogenase E2 component (dihydrolipoamide acetyltransferase)